MTADDRPTSASFGDGHERYGDWDAAYVLGALSLADRRDYEEHLASCAECARSLAALAALPGLLAALPAGEALAMLRDDSGQLGDVGVGDSGARDSGVGISGVEFGVLPGGAHPGSRPTSDLLPALVTRVRRHRRRRLVATIGAGLAAAALIVGILVVQPLTARQAPTATAKLSQVVPSALGADVEFTSETWGTKIDMNCWYGGPAAGSGSSSDQTWRYGLYVTDRSGHTTRVSTWTADPGSRAATSGSIDTALGDLSRVEVRNESSGTVLLARALGGP